MQFELCQKCRDQSIHTIILTGFFKSDKQYSFLSMYNDSKSPVCEIAFEGCLDENDFDERHLLLSSGNDKVFRKTVEVDRESAEARRIVAKLSLDSLADKLESRFCDDGRCGFLMEHNVYDWNINAPPAGRQNV